MDRSYWRMLLNMFWLSKYLHISAPAARTFFVSRSEHHISTLSDMLNLFTPIFASFVFSPAVARLFAQHCLFQILLFVFIIDVEPFSRPISIHSVFFCICLNCLKTMKSGMNPCLIHSTHCLVIGFGIDWILWNSSQCHLRQSISICLRCHHHHRYRHQLHVYHFFRFLGTIVIRKVMAAELAGIPADGSTGWLWT